MRYFEFSVGEHKFSLNENNPSEVRIVFDISATDNVEFSRPTIITLYNVGINFFIIAKQFKGQSMLLRAGVKAKGFSLKQGIEPVTNDVLFVGLVDDVLTAWEGKETKVSFLGRTLPSLKRENAKDYYVAQIEQGQSVAQSIKTIIARYMLDMGKKVTLEIDPNAIQVTTKQKQTMPLRPPKDYLSGLRYFNEILKKFGLTIAQKEDTILIAPINTLERTSASGVMTILKTSLISQPTYADYHTISLQVVLNGKYRLNQFVQLPQEIPLATGDVGGAGALIQRSAGGSAGFLIMQGIFLIIEANHIGDSRNADPMSWATNLLCVRQSNI